MRNGNKRQLHSILHLLWFDQQSFKIEASYNTEKLLRPTEISYAFLQVS